MVVSGKFWCRVCAGVYAEADEDEEIESEIELKRRLSGWVWFGLTRW